MYGKCGVFLDVEKVFDEMFERIIFFWNVMIGVYIFNGLFWEVFELYCEMWVMGVSVDVFIFFCIFKVCSLLRDLRVGKEI